MYWQARAGPPAAFSDDGDSRPSSTSSLSTRGGGEGMGSRRSDPLRLLTARTLRHPASLVLSSVHLAHFGCFMPAFLRTLNPEATIRPARSCPRLGLRGVCRPAARIGPRGISGGGELLESDLGPAVLGFAPENAAEIGGCRSDRVLCPGPQADDQCRLDDRQRRPGPVAGPCGCPGRAMEPRHLALEQGLRHLPVVSVPAFPEFCRCGLCKGRSRCLRQGFHSLFWRLCWP